LLLAVEQVVALAAAAAVAVLELRLLLAFPHLLP
jgi:hypothetical protein